MHKLLARAGHCSWERGLQELAKARDQKCLDTWPEAREAPPSRE